MNKTATENDMPVRNIQDKCKEAAEKVTAALVNTFVLPRHLIDTLETWLTQRIILVMMNQQLRQKPREEESYTAGYDQGYADAKAGKTPNNTCHHE